MNLVSAVRCGQWMSVTDIGETYTPFTLATENGSGTVRHGIRGSVNTIGLRGTVLARHGLKRRAGTVPRSTGSQCKLKRYRAEGWACV